MKTAFLTKIVPVLLPSLAWATFYRSMTGLGDAAPDDSHALFLAGNQNPNATSSVTFDLFSDSTSTTSSSQWTWRVNVSDISVPDATVEFPGEDPPIGDDPHVVNVVWDFEWSGPSGINQAVADGLNASSSSDGTTNTQLCLFGVRADLPANVTGKYSADDDGNCGSTLGSQCVGSILGDILPNPNGCPLLPSFINLLGCEGSLGVTTDLEASGFQLADASAANASSFFSGQGFYYHASAAHAGANTTTYQDEVSTLQMLILAGPVTNQILCQRVGPASTTTASSSIAPSGTGTPTTSTSASPTKGAAAGQRSTSPGASVVGLTALFVGLVIMGAHM
nr:hypothetical protein CFP56_00889 [Quercus suber]